jgi:hypothetical protein
MSKIVISFMSDEAKAKNPDNLFAVLDLDTHGMQWIGLRQLPNTNNFVHGMGMCYNSNYFCAGIIPIRERLASNILTINLKTGEKKISYLYFTKAIHGITTLDKDRLLVNAAQNDCIIELCLKNGHVIGEDLYHHFLKPEYWKQIRNNICNAHNQNTNYRGPTYVDDHHHNNSIIKYKNNIFATMFRADTDRQGTDDGGLMFNLISGEIIIDNLTQPHTSFIDSQGNACVCNSSAFTFIVKNKFIAELDGYTRGIYEDQKNKGYWIGVSAYRKYNAKLSKWIEKYRGDQPLKGARLQFVSYEGNVGDTIELAPYGKEIFDLLPFKKGEWNK